MDIYKLRELLAHKQPGENITISKSILKRPPAGCEETILGDPDGACRQYRCNPNIHMLEYPSEYKTHRDRVDPRKDPSGHLICDSPETLAALIAGGTAGFMVGKVIYSNKGKSENAPRNAILAGSATALVTGLVTYYIVKKLRHN